jgi:bifunctional enzyme CysN/CysC/sulfate adenylyltransferase subunit 1
LGHLETIHIGSDWNLTDFRLPVQWVNRPNHPTDQRLHDFRGFSGQIAGGIVREGQSVVILPSGLVSRVKQIWTLEGALREAFCPQSVTLVLEHDLDVSRGDVIADPQNPPSACTELHARVCWLHSRPLQVGRKYLLKQASQTVVAVVTTVEHRVDMSTLDPENDASELGLNDVGAIRLRTARPLIYDGFATNRQTGSFILIEPGTNATVAAGMLFPPHAVSTPEDKDFTI